MTEQHKYTDVTRLGHKSTLGVLNVGDQIVVQEKLDGANASFRLSDDGATILCYSRNTLLDEHNSLRGFYQWAHEHIDPRGLHPDYVYYGEWLVRHKIDYGAAANDFYMYDVYDTAACVYRDYVTTSIEASALGVKTVPTFYVGPHVSDEHLQQFVGRSEFVKTGEGIVVKNYAYRTRWDSQMFVKMVTPSFAETSQPPKQRVAVESTPERVFAETYVTVARVEKFVHKLADEGIDLDVCPENMGALLRELNPRVFDDIVKEESDSLPDGWDAKALRKAVGAILPGLLKRIGGFA